MLGRTETRTRDRIYCQTMRTVRDISRDDRARIAICSLQQTDRLKENYSIDCASHEGAESVDTYTIIITRQVIRATHQV